MSLRARYASSLLVAALVSSGRSAAAGASAHLVYVRGPGAEKCPDEQAIRQAVRMRLGYDPFFPWAHDTVVVAVAGVLGGFHVGLQLVGDDSRLQGARDLVVPLRDCAGAVDALALTISLAIDPASVLGTASHSASRPSADGEASDDDAARHKDGGPEGRPGASPSAEGAGSAVTSSGGAAPADAKAATPSSGGAAASDADTANRGLVLLGGYPLHAQVGLGAQGSFGRSPSAALGGVVFGSLRWRMLAVDVEAGADLPSTGDSEPGGTVRVQSWLLSGAVAPCVHAGIFFGCGVAAWGLVTATSLGSTGPNQDNGLWWALGPRVAVEVPLSPRLGVRGWGELLWSPAPDTLALDGRTVFTFPGLSGDVGAGLAWTFL